MLSDQGRQAYTSFIAGLYAHYHLSRWEQYSVEPSVAQSLHDKIVEDGNWFLGRIRGSVPVRDLKGKKIGMGVTRPIATRTDTSVPGVERTPRRVMTLDEKGFELFQVNTDTAIGYEEIDQWSMFKDFAARYQRQIRRAVGNDRILCGWHGVDHATTTDPVANPLLEDVNIGWLQLLRNEAVSQIDEDSYGIGSDYPNLDTLVNEAKGLLETVFQDNPDLVVMLSRDLMSNERGQYFAAQGRRPSEKVKVPQGDVIQAYGGLPAMVPPFLPDGHIIITPPKNLAIYWQRNSWRRKHQDKPEKNEVQDFNSRNEGYVVEEYGAICALTNVHYD
uniref:Phage major capsid protein, P2 family n=1 Tax=Candidatus Kentrum sp. FM TaxID=2126340 RepID=A0A450RUR9_9GAMM|nr:MAG: phage major capsid protein, P2 family [Candidatus Kentron sp. FM]VFJ43630.1 MAG: phage major capsid protein, P2 family [Candidatus Kentron sp. FM]VFK05645.1 MAG: phage major capsid protein, P2 family [Candidatus Kentron sp. FM]